MRSSVSYEKKQRDIAKRDGLGLMTIDLIEAGDKTGTMGGRVTVQGPVDAEDAKRVWRFIRSYTARLNAKSSPVGDEAGRDQ